MVLAQTFRSQCTTDCWTSRWVATEDNYWPFGQINLQNRAPTAQARPVNENGIELGFHFITLSGLIWFKCYDGILGVYGFAWNNLLRIEHNIFFCNMMHFEFVITYCICIKKLTPSSGFLLDTCFWQKMPYVHRKNVSFWREVFSGNSRFNYWCIFSDIYESSHCTRVGEQSSVWISWFLQKIHEIWPPQISQSHYIFPSIFIFNVRSYFPVAMAYFETW